MVFGPGRGFPGASAGCKHLSTAGGTPLTNLGPEKIFQQRMD